MLFKMETMQKEAPEERDCFTFLLCVSLCYFEAYVFSSECPRQHHAALLLLDALTFKVSLSSLSASSFPSVTQLLPLSPHVLV